MKKFALILSVSLVLASAYASGKVYFPEIREKAAKIEKLSPEDFKLGRELMKEVRKLAAEKKPAVTAPIISFESLSSAGRMWYTDHNYTDRQLFCGRDKWGSEPASQFQRASHKKTFEIFDLYGINTFNSFVGEHFMRYCDSIEALNSNLKFIPTVTPAGHNGKLNPEFMKRIGKLPYIMRHNGGILYLCWTWLDVPKSREFVKKLEEMTGQPAAFIYSCGTIQALEDPYVFWNKTREVPATTILYWFDFLTQILEFSAGIEFSNRLTTEEGNLNVPYYYDIIMPLFAAVCAQEKYNGKKLCGLEILTGYNNYRGRQRLSANGTKTLREYLAIADYFKLDILKAFEWDEYNEDSHFQPTVNKPMAYQRILKYWNDRNNNKTLSANKGDDLSLPNIIISHRKHAVAGPDYELELLQVPDSDKPEKITVMVEILNEKGQIIHNSGELTFFRSLFTDHTVKVPSWLWINSRVLITRLTIDYNGKRQVIQEGLPFTVVRPTTVCDSTWYSTPLRNVLFPKKSSVSFGKAANPAGALPERIELPVEADLEFPEKLNSLEVMQNGRDTRFSYDPENEFRQNDSDRQSLILSFYRLEIKPGGKFNAKVRIDNAPSAVWFKHPADKTSPYLSDVSVKSLEMVLAENPDYSTTPTSWRRARNISIKKSEMAKAVLHVDGEYLSGPDKGKKFSWTIPLAKLAAAGVYNKIFDDGLQIAIEIPQRMDILPLPLDREKAAFKTVLHTGYPDGVFALRAVSREGKVWWSAPYTVTQPESNKKSPVTVANNPHGAYDLPVDSSRIPSVKYRFDPSVAGNILTTPAGREFYGNIGGYDLVPTGYEGYHCSVYSIPYSFRQKWHNGRRFVPEYEKLADGSWCLNFTGKGEFIGFPPSLFPQRAGYTVKFEFMPLDVDNDQVYFVHGEHDIAGFRLRTEDYRLVLDFYYRQSLTNNAGTGSKTVFKTNLDPVEGKWNKIEFKYDMNKVYITLNGKTESFPCSGLSRWFAVGGFGGDGTKSKNGNQHYFKGKLKSFEVIHSAR